MSYRQVYDNLYASSLTPELHERTCGYWFTVTDGAAAHTAFATRAGLDRWLSERGLSLKNDLPEAGMWGTTRIVGSYCAEFHGEFVSDDPRGGMVEDDAWQQIRPVVTTWALSNGDYTLALVSEDDGVRTVHTLDPNVRSRVTADHASMRTLMS